MSINKTFLYTTKLGHFGGKTETTKEYYSFNTFYIHGFRDKYGIISSSKNKEFYRAIFLLSICWYNGGHLLIVNTNNKFSQLLHNYLRYQFFWSQETSFPVQNRNLNFRSFLAQNYKKNFLAATGPFMGNEGGRADKKFFINLKQTVDSTGCMKKDETKNLSGKIGSQVRMDLEDNFTPLNNESLSPKNFSSTKGKNIISYTSSKIYGGSLTNWKELSKSISRGQSFEKKFGQFILKNNVTFPPFNKLKQSAVQLFEVNSTEKSSFYRKGDLAIDRPDCILIIGGGTTDILRDAFFLEIPTIVSVDSHTPVNFCTYPIWGNTVSIGFIFSIIEWFFRCSQQKKEDGRQ